MKWHLAFTFLSSTAVSNLFPREQQQKTQFCTRVLSQKEVKRSLLCLINLVVSHKQPRPIKFICIKHVFQWTATVYVYELLLFVSRKSGDVSGKWVSNRFKFWDFSIFKERRRTIFAKYPGKWWEKIFLSSVSVPTQRHQGACKNYHLLHFFSTI